jgi:hypothetical protein
MAIRPEDVLTNFNAADANYPEGSFKDASTPSSLDGSELIKIWVNDIYGFLQKLIDIAGITPNGVSDTVLVSDYIKCLSNMIAVGNHATDTGAVNAYIIDVDWDTVDTSTVSTLLTGTIYTFIPANTCTGTSQLTVNGLSAKIIKRMNGLNLQPGDITANKIAIVQYDDNLNTFTLLNPQNSTKIVETKTADYTATPADSIILVNATTGVKTITLPPAAGLKGKLYIIYKIDSSVNNVIIDGNGAETIDGSATKKLYYQYESLIIASDNVNWTVLGRDYIPPSSFHAKRTSGQTIATATLTKVQWQSEDFDIHSEFDIATNHRFTPISPGKYLLHGKIAFFNMTVGKTAELHIYKNGSSEAVTWQHTTLAGNYTFVEVTVELDANGTGDYFELWVRHNEGGNIDIADASLQKANYFIGHRTHREP